MWPPFWAANSAGQYRDELGNDFQTRIQGNPYQASLARPAIKMYDKHGLILRIETTVNDVSFFKHHRRWNIATALEMKTAALKKSIYTPCRS